MNQPKGQVDLDANDRVHARAGNEATMDEHRDARVDDYIASLPDWQAHLAQRVRDLIHDADPDVEETNAAEYSFAMDNAHPLLRERARYVAPPNTENGVVRAISAVLGLPWTGMPD
jgi:haloacid dehalogenase-like hydrolase